MPFDQTNKVKVENKRDMYAMEMNRISDDEYFGDPLLNHTLEDEFVKVEISTNTTSPSFGSVISMHMKFDNPDKFSDAPIYSQNLMNPGCEFNFGANATIFNKYNNSMYEMLFDNNQNIKKKIIEDNPTNSFIQLTFMFNATSIEEPIGASMAWSLDQGHLELRPIFDFRSPNAGLYSAKLNFGCVKIDQKSSFLDTAGFGVLHSPPRNSPSDTSQTMNFYAVYGP